MKLLVVFAAALLCVQAVRVPYITSDSSEEEYHVILPPTETGLVNLPGVGVVNQPIVQAVKVKVPRYASPLLKQQIIEQYLAARGLSLQSFAGEDVDVESNVAVEDLNLHLDSFYNIGLGLQPVNVPQYAVEPPTTALPTYAFSQPVVVIAEALHEPATTTEMSSTTTLDTTTIVPDVIETSTMTELPATEGITEMLDATTTPVSSTDLPTDGAPTETATTIAITGEESSIPLFGFGSLLPASVSHVPFVPRTTIEQPLPTLMATAATPAPVVTPPQSISTTYDVLSTPIFSVHTRLARAVSFNVGDQTTQLTKATPVPPVSKTDVRGPKMSDLSSARKLRAATNVEAAKPPPSAASTNAGVQETTTQTNCDIGCTKFDLNPVCAFNGECYHQFANQCILDTFVCKRPDLGFEARPLERCSLHWLKRCSAEALKSL